MLACGGCEDGGEDCRGQREIIWPSRSRWEPIGVRVSPIDELLPDRDQASSSSSSEPLLAVVQIRPFSCRYLGLDAEHFNIGNVLFCLFDYLQ